MVRGCVILLIGLSLANVGLAAKKKNSTIDFVKFEAVNSDKIIHLNWLVNAENGGHSFVIEKSLDDREWKEITEFPSKANHSTPQSYSTSEINLPERITEHFRIVRVDAKGKREVLDKVKVSQPTFRGVMIIPKGSLHNKEIIVSCSALDRINAVVNVVDLNGVILHKQRMTLLPGYNRTEIEIKGLTESETVVVVIADENGYQQTKSYTVAGKSKRKSKF